jgi:hypothetical protein
MLSALKDSKELILISLIEAKFDEEKRYLRQRMFHSEAFNLICFKLL